jgi:hypothetical protein
MALSKKSLFQRLTQLFRSGPVIRRKIRTTDTTVAVPDREKSSAALLLQKSQSPTYSTITANAYNISERLARFQDFVEMELCLSGDTLIAVPGGYRRIDDLAADCDKDPDKKFVVYAYDHNEKKIVPALGKQARQTVVTDAWKVTFDSGKSITGTSNHRLMLRDGTYCTIGDLKIGDSMMPFYRRDLYAKKGEEKENDYNWIYTMDKNSSHRGWVTEHRVMGEWIMQRSLADNEVVHHVNFNRADNRPENLVVMDALEHQRFHAKILNGKKWSQENSDWIKTFKANHSEWMKENNPATRHDITFGRVLETCERVGFNTTLLCNALDVSMTAITNRLQQNGFKNFETFAKAYNPQWRSDSWCNKGKLNPRFDHTLTFDLIAKNFTPGLKVKELSAKLNTTSTKVLNRLRSQGFSSYKEFAENFNNHKVVSVEYVGVMPLYDLTVDGYKNFSTDSVISHNTPEISAALDLWADESVAQDEKGRVLHVYSDNEKIKELLEDLFYGTLNVEFNLRAWVRNLPVHKDTMIPLLDGRNITIEQLAHEFDDGKQNWVYSTQEVSNRTVPGKVNWCGLTRKNSEIVRIWLDDETYVDCTPDHEWVLRDGSRKQAQHLQIGESLMPFYRDVSSKSNGDKLNGYERVYDASSNSYVYTHRRVAEILDEGVLKDGRWLVTHHKDFNKRNNDPSNLVRVDELEHLKMHGELGKNLLQTPEVKAKRMIGIDTWLRSDRHRTLAKQQLKSLQKKGLMKTSWNDYNSSEQAKFDNEKRSQLLKDVWTNGATQRRAALKIKFDLRCVDMIVERLETLGEYVNPSTLGTKLKADEVFMSYFKSINVGTKRDLTKPFNSSSGITSLLRYVGIESYIDLIATRVQTIASTSKFKRAEKRSRRMRNITSSTLARYDYKNHKVNRIEKLTETSDVYCMEVLGPNGEHDRHNFAVLTIDASGNLSSSGIISSNCKYGDQFLLIDVSPNFGVSNVFPIPVNEIEREENFDPGDPFAVRFRWVTLGNRTMENWEVAHLRLLGNDMFLPYGTSMIEAARRVWRQLILAEDAMLVYRVVRAPERRVFYIDVGNLPANEIEPYMEEQKAKLRTSEVVDRESGRVDLRHNPISILEDFFIGVRGTETGTKIDTLSGGQNTAAVEDVAYIQKKLIAALKIPRAYLGFDESLSSKSTLAQLDIRLSRTVNVIQKTVISELNKIAIIHLFANGFSGDDLQNFVLRLSNPSTVAQQQKLELWRTKFDIGGLMPENMGSAEFVQREIWGLNTDQINNIKSQRIDEKAFNDKLEAGGGGEGGDAGGGADLFGGGGGFDEPMGDEEPTDSGEEQPPAETAADEPEELDEPGVSLLTSADDEFEGYRINDNDGDPVKPNARIKHSQYNHSRRRTHGASKTHMPDFNKMTGYDRKTSKNVYDDDFLKSLHTNPLGESVTIEKFGLAPDVLSMLKNFTNKFGSIESRNSLLSESMDDIDDSILESDDSYDDLNENELVIVEDDFNDPQED